jgi:hypothetical protein
MPSFSQGSTSAQPEAHNGSARGLLGLTPVSHAHFLVRYSPERSKHCPAVHSSVLGHLPHSPPQPSEPHIASVQLGMHWLGSGALGIPGALVMAGGLDGAGALVMAGGFDGPGALDVAGGLEVAGTKTLDDTEGILEAVSVLMAGTALGAGALLSSGATVLGSEDSSTPGV